MKPIKMLFPYPLFSLGIFGVWLILAGTYSNASFTMAALLAVGAGHIARVLNPVPFHVKSVRSLVRLSGIVLYDIVRSNIAVTKIILGNAKTERVSGFVTVPLTMTNPAGLAVLGIIITSTPGTLWVQYDSATGNLLLHILDLVDKEEWVQLIQNRYEHLLMEIFT